MIKSVPSTSIHLGAQRTSVPEQAHPFLLQFWWSRLKSVQWKGSDDSLLHAVTTLLEEKCCLISDVLRCFNNFNECHLVMPELFSLKKVSWHSLDRPVVICRLQSDHFCFSSLLRSTDSVPKVCFRKASPSFHLCWIFTICSLSFL